MAVGVGVDMIRPMPVDRMGDPGTASTMSATGCSPTGTSWRWSRNPDSRPPTRSIDIHLTGNMERFMWSFDGEKFSELASRSASRGTSGCGSR